jgi:hypothetical protein
VVSTSGRELRLEVVMAQEMMDVEDRATSPPPPHTHTHSHASVTLQDSWIQQLANDVWAHRRGS